MAHACNCAHHQSPAPGAWPAFVLRALSVDQSIGSGMHRVQAYGGFGGARKNAGEAFLCIYLAPQALSSRPMCAFVNPNQGSCMKNAVTVEW